MTTESNIETRLLRYIESFVSRLPKQDVENAAYLVAKREWGIGLEVLCTQLMENEVNLSTEEALELKHLACAIEFDISTFGLVD